MFYPEKFIERVKKAYPDSSEIHQALECGDSILGLHINTSITETHFTLAEILTATSLIELQNEAKVRQERVLIDRWWHSLYDEQVKNG